jgi:hypothetical protein
MNRHEKLKEYTFQLLACALDTDEHPPAVQQSAQFTLDDMFGADPVWALAAVGFVTGAVMETIPAENAKNSSEYAAAKRRLQCYIARHQDVASEFRSEDVCAKRFLHILTLAVAPATAALWVDDIAMLYGIMPGAVATSQFHDQQSTARKIVEVVLREAEHGATFENRLAAITAIGHLDFFALMIVSLTDVKRILTAIMSLTPSSDEVPMVEEPPKPTDKATKTPIPRSTDYGKARKEQAKCRAKTPTGRLVDEALNTAYRLCCALDNESDQVSVRFAHQFLEYFMPAGINASRWRYEGGETFGSLIANNEVYRDDFAKPLASAFLAIAKNSSLELEIRSHGLWVLSMAVYNDEASKDFIMLELKDVVNVIAELIPLAVNFDFATYEEYRLMETEDIACSVLDDLSQAYGTIGEQVLELAQQLQDSANPKERAGAVLLIMYALEGIEADLLDTDDSLTALGGALLAIIERRVNPATEPHAGVRFLAWRCVSEIPIICMPFMALNLMEHATNAITTEATEIARSNALDIIADRLEKTGDAAGADVSPLEETDEDSDGTDDASAGDDGNAGDGDDESDGGEDDDGWSEAGTAEPEEVAAMKARELMSGEPATLLAKAVLSSRLVHSNLGFVKLRAVECLKSLAWYHLPTDVAQELMQCFLSELESLTKKPSPMKATEFVAVDGTQRRLIPAGSDLLSTVRDSVRATCFFGVTRLLDAVHESFLATRDKRVIDTIIAPALDYCVRYQRQGRLDPGTITGRAILSIWTVITKFAAIDITALGPHVPLMCNTMLFGAATETSSKPVPLAELTAEERNHPETEVNQEIDTYGNVTQIAVSYRAARNLEFRTSSLRLLSYFIRHVPTDVAAVHLFDIIAICKFTITATEDTEALRSYEFRMNPLNAFDPPAELALETLQLMCDKHLANVPPRLGTIAAVHFLVMNPCGIFVELQRKALSCVTDLDVFKRWTALLYLQHAFNFQSRIARYVQDWVFGLYMDVRRRWEVGRPRAADDSSDEDGDDDESEAGAAEIHEWQDEEFRLTFDISGIVEGCIRVVRDAHFVMGLENPCDGAFQSMESDETVSRDLSRNFVLLIAYGVSNYFDPQWVGTVNLTPFLSPVASTIIRAAVPWQQLQKFSSEVHASAHSKGKDVKKPSGKKTKKQEDEAAVRELLGLMPPFEVDARFSKPIDVVRQARTGFATISRLMRRCCGLTADHPAFITIRTFLDMCRARECIVRFLTRTDLRQHREKADIMGAIANAISAIVAMGGGPVWYVEDHPLPGCPVAWIPSGFLPPFCDDFNYAEVLELIADYLPATGDAGEKHATHHDIVQWLTNPEHPGYAAVQSVPASTRQSIAKSLLPHVTQEDQELLQAMHTSSKSVSAKSGGATTTKRSKRQ